MSDLQLYMRAGWALLRRDFQVFVSYPGRTFTLMLGAFFSLTLFYYISRLVTVDTFRTPDAYYSFAVVGLVILQVLNSTLLTPPMTLRSEQAMGTFERLMLSPFGPVGSILSFLVFPMLMAIFMGLVMLTFAGVVFGLDVRWSTMPLSVPIGILASLSFAPFGLAILALVLVFKQALAGTTWIIAGIAVISGLYFPVTLLPGWIEWASDVQPFTPAVDLLRHVLVGTDLRDPAWLDLLRLGLFAVVLLPLATWMLARAVDFGRRRGTLAEV